MSSAIRTIHRFAVSFQYRFSPSVSFDTAATKIILEAEDVIERRDKVSDILSGRPRFVMDLDYPIEDLGGTVNFRKADPVLMVIIVKERVGFLVELPVAP
jgi:hypothetical protein